MNTHEHLTYDNLKKEVAKYEYFYKINPNQLQQTVNELSNKVLNEILARCTVCSTPANPPYK